ncbi:DipZ protein [Conexibacter sp. SYSU D00693]|uniref:DipZ protein n=1 Tax=Conexibacter sp. SYSU D00693 TaxID=2812560 RepID=UPI00196AC255|nr:DipZ protein [Conexibacter sp. SYSU D00693]
MRPPVDDIHAPPFPRPATWLNVKLLRMDQQRDRPVLVEFFDVCRVNSLRTLPYVKAWHERYADDGLRVVSVHAPGFPPSQDEDVVRATVERLGVVHPVLLDQELALWRTYENRGWPARYLFSRQHRLVDFHFGEGAYQETERAIQEALGIERDVLPPLRPEDDPVALLAVPTPDQPGLWSGPYEAGGVWAVLEVPEGGGTVVVNGDAREVPYTGCHPLVEHERHTEAVLELEAGDGVTCHAVCFTPGLAPEGAEPTAQA